VYYCIYEAGIGIEAVDDSTAQGNTKGWGPTNRLKQYKLTKYNPRLNIKHTRPNWGRKK